MVCWTTKQGRVKKECWSGFMTTLNGLHGKGDMSAHTEEDGGTSHTAHGGQTVPAVGWQAQGLQSRSVPGVCREQSGGMTNCCA